MTATPTAPTGTTELSIVVNDGSGERQTWQPKCDPAGGTHPDPEAACAALLANGALALPAVRKDVVCTDIYGGPEKATISGTFQGQEGIELVLPGERVRDRPLGPAEGPAAARRL